ncbi:MAG: alpha-galactosidase [Planctomycetaceae bacterium]|nr:alpha-galactosidase [Planctomycetaceae bacterium]
MKNFKLLVLSGLLTFAASQALVQIAAQDDKSKDVFNQDVSMTNGVVTVTWNAKNTQIEIADKKGVYAIAPLDKNNIDKIEIESSKDGHSILLSFLNENLTITIIDGRNNEKEDDFFNTPDSWKQMVLFSIVFDRDKNTTLRFPTIELQLPQNADQLKSFGAAGLKPVDGHKGSYMFLSIVDPKTRSGVVSGWITAAEASGIIFSKKTDDGKVQIIPESQYGKATKPFQGSISSVFLHQLSEFFVIGRFDDCRDGLESYIDAVSQWESAKQEIAKHPLKNKQNFMKAASEANWPRLKLKPIPAGYCTWYSNKYGGASDAKHLKELAEVAEKKLKPYGFNFIQIDDHWQEGISSNGPKKNFTTHNPKGPYPDGMKPSAEMLEQLGFTAGLWFMPFAGSVTDSHFPKEWFAKSTVTDEVDANGKSKRPYNSIVNKEGEPYESFWGGTSLDMTNPDVQKYLSEEVKRIYSDWGYHYFKLDGLWTGMACDQLYVNNEYKPDDLGKVKFYDDEHFTPVAAYRKGFQIIREAAPDAFILGCCVSQNMRMMHPSIGYCDAMRIGPDNGSGWNSLKAGPWHGSNRYFLNGRVWWNDPDPVYVRDSIPLEHARLITSWVSVAGQLFTFSDWLPELSPERVEVLQKTMRPHGLTTARPVDLFENDLPKIWTLTNEKSGERRTIVAFYNWDDKKPASIETTAEKLGLPQAKQYVAFDYWEDKLVEPFGETLRVELPPGTCRIFSVKSFDEKRPVLISVSSHVTQGIIDVEREKYENGQLVVRVKAFNTDPIELRFVVPTDEKLIRKTVTPKEAGEIVEYVLTN